mmetsp:Transcript_104920/g.313462  ORF Transcript_104920/g.313462 Transcript_104920/m.313462 type:complete len:427 (-) Transcript_104920:51-1331(-)
MVRPGLLAALLAALLPALPSATEVAEKVPAEEDAPSVNLVQAGWGLHTREALLKEEFLAFVRTYKRAYEHGSLEFEDRFEHWRRTREQVGTQNTRPDRLWTAGINHLADWSPEELKRLNGWRGSVVQDTKGALLDEGGDIRRRKRELPKEFKNWTMLDTARDIRDQGQCGSCWAMTSTTVLQAHSEIYTGNANKFSTQELVDCVPNPEACGGTGGCNGATVELAMDYVTRFGLTTEKELPYKATDGTCHSQQPDPGVPAFMDGSDDYREHLAAIVKPGVHLTHLASVNAMGMYAWERLPENEYEPLMRAVVEYGPVAVSVAADGWNLYSHGIFDSCEKDAVINHAVTLLGYGTSPTEHWIIQNSWGSSWGENGHLRLLRRDGNEHNCGTDYQPSAGTGCNGGPSSVKVCGMCGVLYDSVVPHFREL